MKEKIYKRFILALAILALTLPARIIGIDHGINERWIAHPDVKKQSIVAEKTYKNQSNPHKIYSNDNDPENYQLTLYPYGTAYVAGKSGHLFAKLSSNNRFAFMKKNIYFWTWYLRVINTVSFAFALVLLMSLLYDKMKLLPLVITGLLLSLEPFHAQYSHYGMNDIPMLSILLMAWISASYMKGNALQKYGLSFVTGFLLGAGLGVKYQAVIGFMFPGFIWLDWLFAKKWKEICISVSVTALAFVIGTSTTCPLLWTEPGYFFQNLPEFMHWQSHILRYRNVTDEIYEMPFAPKVLSNTLWCLRYYLKSGLIVFFPALVWGCITCIKQWRRHPRFQLIISSLAFFLFMNFIIITCRDMMRTNDLLISTPFLILLAGLMIDEYAEKWKEQQMLFRRTALYAAAFVVIACFLVSSTLDSIAFTRPDTRVLAKEWCRENLKPGVLIRERYTLSPRMRNIQDYRPSFLSHDKLMNNAVKRGYFNYLMSSSIAHNRFLDPLSPYYDKGIKKFYESLPEKYEILAEFRDRELCFTHPVITIYGKKNQ